MEIKKVYKELVSNLKTFLKGYNFKKQGNQFILNDSGNLAIIGFQKSSKSTKDKIIFTINIGITSKLLQDFYENTSISIEDSHWRERIGFFINHKDIWWEINKTTNIEPLCEELKSLIQDKVIPQLLNNINDVGLVRLLSDNSGGATDIERFMSMSVLLKEQGKTKEMNKLIYAMLDSYKDKPALSLIKLHLKDIGIAYE